MSDYPSNSCGGDYKFGGSTVMYYLSDFNNNLLKVMENWLWQMAVFMKDSLSMEKSKDMDFAAGLQQGMNTQASL